MSPPPLSRFIVVRLGVEGGQQVAYVEGFTPDGLTIVRCWRLNARRWSDAAVVPPADVLGRASITDLNRFEVDISTAPKGFT